MTPRGATRPPSRTGDETTFRRIAESAPAMIWVSGPDRQVDWANHQRSRFIGVEPASVLGLRWIDYVHPDDRDTCIARYHKAFEAREPVRMEYRLKHFTGDYRWILSHWVPDFDSGGKFQGLIGCCIDVHELKSAQAQREHNHRFVEQLIDVGDRQSEVVASSLHDKVLQPLLAAKMHVQSFADMESVTERAIENLDRASNLLNSVADECLQIINRTRPLIIDEQGVQIAIQHLIAELSEQQAVHFTLTCEGELGRLPRLWEGSLYWIVSEALENVVSHSKACRAAVTMKVDQQTVMIEVEDDGEGFDRDEVSSAAFGLRAIEERARVFGGRYSLRSQEGAGTKLSVTIPLPHELDA